MFLLCLMCLALLWSFTQGCDHSRKDPGFLYLQKFFYALSIPHTHFHFFSSCTVPRLPPMSWLVCLKQTHLLFHFDIYTVQYYFISLPSDTLLTCLYHLNVLLFTNATISHFTLSKPQVISKFSHTYFVFSGAILQ